MDYYINPASFQAVFTVPAAVVDNCLKFAKAEHVKVLLYIMRNLSAEISADIVAESTGVDKYDVGEALLYWADAGILMPKEGAVIKKEAEEKTLSRSEKPTRTDVAKRGNEDPKIMYLLREAQIKFGRNLKSNETSTLVWLYDDQGLDVSLILLIVQYAVAHNRCNIRFIESTAVDWVNKGIDDITAGDEELRKLAMGEQAWGIVASAFGLERRKPSKKETELSLKWIDEWQLSRQMLERAYEECVNTKSKFSFAYTAKIIESWHEKGYEKPEDVAEKPKTEKGDGFAAYDLDLFEKMINSKD